MDEDPEEKEIIFPTNLMQGEESRYNFGAQLLYLHGFYNTSIRYNVPISTKLKAALITHSINRTKSLNYSNLTKKEKENVFLNLNLGM